MRGLTRERADAFGEPLRAWLDTALECGAAASDARLDPTLPAVTARHGDSPVARERLDGDPPLAQRFTASLLHVDASGQVLTSLLSVGELTVPSTTRLRLAVWPGARVGRHLADGRGISLTFVFQRAFHQWHCTAPRRLLAPGARAPSCPTSTADATFDAFELEVAGGEWQSVDYARLSHGIEFDLAAGDDPARAETLARWLDQRRCLRAMV